MIVRAIVCVALVLTLLACGRENANSGDRAGAALGLRYLQSDNDTAGFATANGPRTFSFPADHGSHPGYRTEWWYFTGNVAAADGSAYGFELTFFRVALQASQEASQRPSAWASDEVWMAHLAVTDGSKGRFVARERISRAVLGLAGAEENPVRVSVKGWSAARADHTEGEDWELAASDRDVGLRLRLTTNDAPVANGDSGFDRKGGERGNASYYYSLPRLEATGELMLGDEHIPVHGSAWMDREWSTSALGAEVVGWDWFGLRLSDGSSLMFYRLRRRDGSADAFSSGMYVDGLGRQQRLEREDVVLAPLAYWTSPIEGVRYPVSWRMTIRGSGLSFELRPIVDNQELDLSVRYWEGAVRGEGTTAGGGTVSVEGYLELAGY
jgi:predicted secreted hydrolase